LEHSAAVLTSSSGNAADVFPAPLADVDALRMDSVDINDAVRPSASEHLSTLSSARQPALTWPSREFFIEISLLANVTARHPAAHALAQLALFPPGRSDCSDFTQGRSDFQTKLYLVNTGQIVHYFAKLTYDMAWLAGKRCIDQHAMSDLTTIDRQLGEAFDQPGWVYERIRDEIVSGRLGPNERLKVADLAAARSAPRLDESRTKASSMVARAAAVGL